MGTDSALASFLDAANRVADATQLHGMDVGAIWYQAEGQVLLQLRAVLSPLSTPGIKDRFATRQLGAVRVVLQRTDWESFISGLGESRLVLGGGADLDFHIGGGQRPIWSYRSKAHLAEMKGPAIAVAAHGASFNEVDERTTYEATFEDADRSVVGVNVFVRSVEEVRFHAAVDAPSLLDLRPTRRRPAPRAGEDRAKLRALHVEGYRCLRDVKVEFGDLKVLVGPNQAGKNTILEALAIVRDAMAGSLYDALIRRRDAFRQLLWRSSPGAPTMQFDADLDLGGRQLRFGFVLGAVGPGDDAVERETFHERKASKWRLLLSATKGVAEVDGVQVRTDDPHELMLPSLRSREHGDALRAVAAGLMSIAVYPGFQTGALWADPDHARMRQASRIEPNARLDPLGGNLRLVFPRLQEISFPPAEAGRIQIAWREEGSKAPFFGSELSDGTLHFLATLCALYQEATLIALDEPERHLHPEALYRLVSAAAKVADKMPVLLATQSDRLLGFLDETPEAITILRRGSTGTEVVRPDVDQLADWLKRFSLSDLRHELESWGVTA